MPHPCVVCGRSRMNPNNREEEYMFFGFPVNDEQRCRYWLEFCGREDLYKLTKKQLLQRMVCSKHFQSQDFLNEYLDRLNHTAVPSVYDPKQSLYNITCVLCGRTRRDPPTADYDGTTFHHFPGEEFRCLKWLDFVGVDSYYRLTRKEILFCYICSKHFDRSQFVPGFKGRLMENAVPKFRNADHVDQSEPSIVDSQVESKLFSFPDKCKKLESLPTEVLESQACAACGRLRSDPRNKIEHYKFHPFPAYEIGRCLRWCQFLGREDLLKMSPNQIRKLVLCSKHFQAKQSFHKIGPCDAVPTIKDIAESENVSEQNEDDQYLDGEDGKDSSKVFKRPVSRPLVSSKKPKVDNKPAPLAKKRGKSRRPTSINIPRLNPNNTENQIKKLPLPPTTNWKIQLGDQFQPITINNVASNNVTNNLQGSVKKIIVPFSGDISTLGAPIPVHSLSSIPPGLLIKINLPEQEQQNLQKASRIKKQNKMKNYTSNSSEQQIWMKNNQTSAILQKTKQNMDKSLVEILSMSTESNEEILNSNKVQVQEEETLPHSLEILEDETGLQVSVKKKHYFEELEDLKQNVMKRRKRRRKKITGTMRRTMFPIRSEIRHFLRKIAPLVHRLPTRARATLKLSIVNMVIDQL